MILYAYKISICIYLYTHIHIYIYLMYTWQYLTISDNIWQYVIWCNIYIFIHTYIPVNWNIQFKMVEVHFCLGNGRFMGKCVFWNPAEISFRSCSCALPPKQRAANINHFFSCVLWMKVGSHHISIENLLSMLLCTDSSWLTWDYTHKIFTHKCALSDRVDTKSVSMEL